jgi:two-component system chemotaxis response regulator CheB
VSPAGPASKVDVLLVHDSPTVRASLRRTIESDPELRVVGELSSGRGIVEAIERLSPSVIVMDVVMPGIDGWAATRLVMEHAPRPIVLVSQVVDPRDARVALEAIRAGALAIVDPPAYVDGERSHRREMFLSMLRSAAIARVGRPSAPPTAIARATRMRRPARAIGIATSTGGPPALASILEALPVGGFAPLLVVQHLAKGFSAGLASWLSTVCKHQVVVATDGARAERGAVYVAPEDRHLGIGRDLRLVVSDAAPEGQFRPSGTWLLRSIATALGPAGGGVVLTGMGEDGALGALDLRRAGGEVIAQDEASSVVYGMPAAAAARGAVDEVVPLAEVAQWIVEKSYP